MSILDYNLKLQIQINGNFYESELIMNSGYESNNDNYISLY